MPAARCLVCYRYAQPHPRPGGPAVIPHAPGCPQANAPDRPTPPGFMDMPILPVTDVQPITGEIKRVDNRDQLVSILRDGFGWTISHDDTMGLTYTAPDRTTAVVFDDVQDNDLSVIRYAPPPATATNEVWKVSMTASTPTRVMLAVAMGA